MAQQVSSFVHWYNHRHPHTGIKFVTPQQRHSGQAVEICRHRAVIYEQARQRNPRRWLRLTRCWRQPEVVWINPPPPTTEPTPLHQSCCLNSSRSVIFPEVDPDYRRISNYLGKQTNLELIALDPFNSDLSPQKK
jgi:hypothetical protein